MTFQGRTVIKVAYTEVNDNNIIDILSKGLAIHLSNSTQIYYLFNYYKGIQEILKREKIYRKEVNNKLVENHADEIVSFKVGYLLNKPIQYIARKESTNAKALALLTDYMLYENKEGKDKSVAKHQSICGLGYRLTLVNPKYKPDNDESPYTITTIFPTKAFVIYTDEFDSKPLLGVFIDKIMIEGVEVQRLQAYDDKFKYTVINNVLVTKEAHTYGDIPLVEYPLNEERMGDFEKVLGLLDAINNVQSNRLDGVEQFIQSLMVFKNVDLDDENFKKLKEMGAIKIKDNGELEANVSFLTQELNQQQVQSLKNDLMNVVRTIVGMPTQQDGSKSVSSNNGAMAMSNGWQNADIRASETEIMFKESERRFLRIALRIARALTKNTMSLTLGDIDIKFTRRNYEDLWVKSQTLTSMLKEPKIAPRLAFVSCGLFPDPEQAYEESKTHYEDYLKEQQALLNKGKDNEDNVEVEK